MPDTCLRICHNDGTGCAATVSPVERAARRRQAIFDQLSAESAYSRPTAEEASTESSVETLVRSGATTPLAVLADPVINPLLGAPARRLSQVVDQDLGQAAADGLPSGAADYPLLARAALRDPILREAIRLDRSTPPQHD